MFITTIYSGNKKFRYSKLIETFSSRNIAKATALVFYFFFRYDSLWDMYIMWVGGCGSVKTNRRFNFFFLKLIQNKFHACSSSLYPEATSKLLNFSRELARHFSVEFDALSIIEFKTFFTFLGYFHRRTFWNILSPVCLLSSWTFCMHLRFGIYGDKFIFRVKFLQYIRNSCFF